MEATLRILSNLIGTLKSNGTITASQADTFHIGCATELDAERLAAKASQVAMVNPEAVQAIVDKAIADAMAKFAALSPTQAVATAAATPPAPVVAAAPATVAVVKPAPATVTFFGAEYRVESAELRAKFNAERRIDPQVYGPGQGPLTADGAIEAFAVVKPLGDCKYWQPTLRFQNDDTTAAFLGVAYYTVDELAQAS